ncbi:MAG TPA: hypothetical protein VN450_02810 [Candidatus Methylomirabilis sp.]|nr:hypothetical protein [Candidatus Methylomirabilis sp.]
MPHRLAAERVYVSVRGRGTLRVTPHVYNTEADIDRLIRAIGARGLTAAARTG